MQSVPETPAREKPRRSCYVWESSPGQHVLTITVFHKRAAADDFHYLLRPVASQLGGAGFVLVKVTDSAERPTYSVNLDGARSTCDCPGHTFHRQGKPCKHIEALLALLAAGKLPAPAAEGGAA
jgi:hypothetical protein